MTLVLALIGTDGIAVAADSQGLRSAANGGGYYPSRWRKNIELGSGCLVGIADNGGIAVELLKYARSHAVDFNHWTRFQEIVWNFGKSFREGYRHICHSEPSKETSAEWLFCGYGPEGGERIPTLYTISLWDGVFVPEQWPQWQAIGIHYHGGAYYACRYYESTMTAMQLAFLGYFCICEVAVDPRVALPVEVAIIPKEGATQFLSGPTLETFQKRHLEAHNNLISLFRR